MTPHIKAAAATAAFFGAMGVIWAFPNVGLLAAVAVLLLCFVAVVYSSFMLAFL